MKVFSALLFSLVINAGAAPLSIHPDNPYYFLYDGKPAVLIGSGEHYGAFINLDFDCDVYLETMEEEGQNLTRVFTGSYVEKIGAFGILKNSLAPDKNRFQPPWARSETPGYVNGGNKFDLDKWNPEYFIRLKDFIKKAGDHGIIVELVLFSSIYEVDNWRLMPFHPANNINGTNLDDYRKCNTLDNGKIFSFQEQMVRKIVRELNEFDNVYYEIQNEPWPDQADPAGVVLEHLKDDKLPDPWQNMVNLASEASLKWQKTISEIITDEEKTLSKKHLIAQNYCNFLYPVPQVGENISVLNFHYALPQCVDVNLGWKRPVAFDESGFAGPGPDVYRRQAWRFIASGGSVFNGLDYSFYPGFENGKGELFGPGGGGSELRLQLAVLRRFIESFDLRGLHPDKTTISHHPGFFIYLLSDPGKQYACYLEGRGTGTLTMQLPSGEYEVKWIEVQTGEVLRKDELNHHQQGPVVLHTPDSTGELALDIRGK